MKTDAELEELVILPEIEKALFPLRPEERERLEESVLHEGIRDPLVVWPREDGAKVLVDGHHRYRLAKKHGLVFEVVEREFLDLDEVLDWIDRNQIARRNLTDEQRLVVLGRIYERQKKAPVGFADRTSPGVNLTPGAQHHATAKAIAGTAGVGEKTVRRAAEFAKAVEALQEVSPEAAGRVLRGEVRDAITRLPRVAKDRPEDLPGIAEKLAAGARSISEVLQPPQDGHVEEARPEPEEPNGSVREAETNHRPAVHFSSERMDWETPQDFFDRLDAEFGFELDVCAIPENAKCPKFFTPEEDGLKQRWSGICWMKPPYGNEIANWMRKAYEESRRGAVVVCLVPSRTDTGWWHEFAMKAEEIRFVRGRLRFGDAETSAPFPSAVVVLRPGHEGPPRVSGMNADG